MNIRQKIVILAGLCVFLPGAGCEWLGASGGRETTTGSTEAAVAQDQVTPSVGQPGIVVVSGFFVRSFGDPPPGGNGRARINYTVTTSAGKEWILVFDEDRYWPANGIRGFHLKQVAVKGYFMPDGSLLVELLELE